MVGNVNLLQYLAPTLQLSTRGSCRSQIVNFDNANIVQIMTNFTLLSTLLQQGLKFYHERILFPSKIFFVELFNDH